MMILMRWYAGILVLCAASCVIFINTMSQLWPPTQFNNTNETRGTHSSSQHKQTKLTLTETDRYKSVGGNVSMAYVYSAYLDDRRASDVTRMKINVSSVVRVFSWIHNKLLGDVQHWRCVFWSKELKHIGDVEVAGWTKTNQFDNTNRVLIVGTMILWPYNRTLGANFTASEYSKWQPPFYVSVSVAHQRLSHPSGHIVVNNLIEKRNRTAYSSTNENENDCRGNRSSIMSFAVCVRPVYGKSISVEQLVEFIEVNRLFGSEMFFFYIDSSLDEKLRRCIDKYESIGLVESVAWSIPADIESLVAEKGQYMAMTECAYRMMYRTKYLAVTDMDEFIVPTQTDDWNSMLAKINAGNANRIASYSFRNRFFPLPSAKGSDRIERPLVVRTTRAEDYLFPWKVRSKMMAAPERILRWHTHEILDSDVVPHGERNVYVDQDHAVMHHYRRDVSANAIKSNYTRMLHFMSKITPRIKHSLRMCLA